MDRKRVIPTVRRLFDNVHSSNIRISRAQFTILYALEKGPGLRLARSWLASALVEG